MWARLCAWYQSYTNMEHAIHRPIESRRAYRQRRHTIAFAMVLALSVAVALSLLLLG